MSFAVPLWVWAPASAQEVSGVAEIRLSEQIGASGVPWQLTERIRPEFVAKINDRVSVTATIDVFFSQGRSLQTEIEDVFESSNLTSLKYAQRYLGESAVNSLWDIAGCEWPDEAPNAALGISKLSDYTTLDRLYVDAYLPGVDLRIGRQPVQWGSAQLVNPTDPFPEVLFVEPWRYRGGLNSARATIPIGDDHQVQLLAGSDDALVHERLATRATVRALNTDISGVAAWRGDTKEPILGLDLRGNLEVGWWFEGAVHMVEVPYEEFAVGVDYSFPVFERLYLSAQYYRNGSGDAEPGADDLTGRFASQVEPPTCDDPSVGALFPTSSNPYAPFTAGRDYLLAVLNSQITADFGISAATIQNLGDGTGVFVPTATVGALEWLEFSATAQVPYKAWGDGGEFRPDPDDMHLEVDVANLGINGFADAKPIDLDFSGLVADAALVIWTRAHF